MASATPALIRREMLKVLEAIPNASVDYVSIANADTLAELNSIDPSRLDSSLPSSPHRLHQVDRQPNTSTLGYHRHALS